MTDNEYLAAILESQTLKPDSDERKELDRHATEVMEILRNEYGYSPTLIIGGSVEKGTLIAEAYDLDLHFYFANDDDTAGETLEAIYGHVARTLEKVYTLNRKRSAIRLQTRDEAGRFTDLHVDVVPGRFIPDNSGDVFLHQHEGEKGRLKTNIRVQIAHVKQSGVIEAIRLTKLWRERNRLDTKTFILELLIIEILKEHKANSLAEQFVLVLEAFRDQLDEIAIEDPANPTGNDLSLVFNESAKDQLAKAADETLEKIRKDGIQSLFGEVKTKAAMPDRVARLNALAGRVTTSYRPWYGSGRPHA